MAAWSSWHCLCVGGVAGEERGADLSLALPALHLHFFFHPLNPPLPPLPLFPIPWPPLLSSTTTALLHPTSSPPSPAPPSHPLLPLHLPLPCPCLCLSLCRLHCGLGQLPAEMLRLRRARGTHQLQAARAGALSHQSRRHASAAGGKGRGLLVIRAGGTHQLRAVIHTSCNTHTNTHKHTHTRTHTLSLTHTHARSHAHTHAHTHVHTRTHTCTQQAHMHA